MGPRGIARSICNRVDVFPVPARAEIMRLLCEALAAARMASCSSVLVIYPYPHDAVPLLIQLQAQPDKPQPNNQTPECGRSFRLLDPMEYERIYGVHISWICVSVRSVARLFPFQLKSFPIARSVTLARVR